MFPHIYSNARSCNLSSMDQRNWQKSVVLGKVSLARFWPSTDFQTVVNWFVWPSYNWAPLSNESQNQTSHSPHNLTLLKNKSDTQPVKKNSMKVITSLCFSEPGRAVDWWRQLYSHTISTALPLGHFLLNLDVLMWVLDELRSFWNNRTGEICLF